LTGIAGPDPEPEPEVVATRRAVGGRKYRVVEDPDKLLADLHREEKKVEKEKKRLLVLVKRASQPSVEGVLYQQIQEKIQVLEAKVDDRLMKIAEIMSAVQTALDDEDDEEEMLFS
jgi:uncharacterized protein YeeX (DUF496 family)